MRLHFRFVGGPQDGRILAVPSPVSVGMEVSVRPEEPYLPCSPYRLTKDGVFRYIESPEDDLESALEPCATNGG